MNKDKLEKRLYDISLVGVIISIVLTAIISYLSLISGEKLKAISFIAFGDKGAHMLAYSALGLFLYLAFIKVSFNAHHRDRDIVDSNWVLLPTFFTIVCGLIIGIIIEFIQSKVGRQFEILDIVSDGLGLVVGCAIGYYILKSYLTIVTAKDEME